MAEAFGILDRLPVTGMGILWSSRSRLIYGVQKAFFAVKTTAKAKFVRLIQKEKP